MQNSVELCSSERLLQPLCNPYVNYGQLCFWLFTISFYGKMTGLLMPHVLATVSMDDLGGSTHPSSWVASLSYPQPSRLEFQGPAG